MNFDNFINFISSILSNSILSIIVYLIIYLILWSLLATPLSFILKILSPKKWASHILRFKSPALLGILLPGLWIFYGRLDLQESGLHLAKIIIQTLAYISFFWSLHASSYYLFSIFRKVAQKTESKLDDQFLPILEKLSGVLIFTLALLLILQNFGIQVFSVLAGLGLGGLALALAAKDSAANLFGSMMILADQPFNIGDWVKIGESEGTVEEIGLRSTRIRTFYNSLIIIPNSIVAISTLDNLGKREFRRFRHIIGIEYGTPKENIDRFMDELKKWLSTASLTINDRTQVRMNSLGSHSLDVLVYVFFKVNNWDEELVERERLIFKILELSEKHAAPIAFPTQTLHIKKEPSA